MNREFSITWVPEPVGSTLLAQLGVVEQLAFPHFVEGVPSDSQLSFNPSEKTLSLGILLATLDSARYLGPSTPSAQQYRVALQLCCPAFGVPDEDSLCVHAAAYLREQYTQDLAIRALERAIQLIPGARKCRDDLLTDVGSVAAQRTPLRNDVVQPLASSANALSTPRFRPKLHDVVLFGGGGIGIVAGGIHAGFVGALTGGVTAFCASVAIQIGQAPRIQAKVFGALAIVLLLLGAVLGGWSWGWSGATAGLLVSTVIGRIFDLP